MVAPFTDLRDGDAENLIHTLGKGKLFNGWNVRCKLFRITEQGNGLCRLDKKTGFMLHSLCKSAREAGDCVKLTHRERGKRVLAHSCDCLAR